MEAIYNNESFDTTNANESVRNLYERYNDIIDLFPEDDINDEMLLHFCDWLAEKVFFIEIIATTEQDAHKVFVTMNDRGLSLTSTEMLKGYLLSEIKDDKRREQLNELWKERVLVLRTDDDKGDETFIKAWLRAQYAETIRDTKAGAENKDFDIIGGPFHKWVREEREKLGLNSSIDYEKFIEKFAKYSEVYKKIKEAESILSEETKYVYYNAQIGFTLQGLLLLAPICYEDSWPVIIEKMNLTARYVDLLILSRVTNYRSVDYSTIKNYVFSVVRDIRRCDVDELKIRLFRQYRKLNYNSSQAIPSFGVNSFTKKYVKNLLARVTSFIEEQTGVAPGYSDYMNYNTKNPYEIEHIITDHYEWFTDEYIDPDDFRRWRNNIGALLLLHKSINASLNDSKYEYKLSKYCSNEGNIYTESLGDQAYQNNPKFKHFIEDSQLPFESYTSFGKNEISRRAELVTKLVDLVWNPDMFMCDGIQDLLEEEEEERELSDKENRARIPNGEYYLSEIREGFGKVTATMVVESGNFIVKKGSICSPVSEGVVWIPEARKKAIIKNSILMEDVSCKAPSTAGWVVLGKANNGWNVWRDMEGNPLDHYRRQ